MKFGFVFPGGDARTAADFAHEAEQAGWDGFFVWEPVWGVDAWVSLTAAAMRTERIRLGTMISPLSRMRPWEVASRTATLDRLSGGRVILSVGLGALDSGFEAFGEVTDRKTRAELLDESLDILSGLWRGQPFSYDGKHYHLKPTTFFAPPPPIQQPGIPVWCVGAWPHEKSMRRALRCDGLLPTAIPKGGSARQASLDELREIAGYVRKNRAKEGPFDIVAEGSTPGDKPAEAGAAVRPWAEAGATWWTETMWPALDQEVDDKGVLARIRQGPPRL